MQRMWSGGPPEAHTPYLASVGLTQAEATAFAPTSIQPAEAPQTSEVRPPPQQSPERSAPQSPFDGGTVALAPGQREPARLASSEHAHALAKAGAAHRADVLALSKHLEARELQLQAWCLYLLWRGAHPRDTLGGAPGAAMYVCSRAGSKLVPVRAMGCCRPNARHSCRRGADCTVVGA